ncbi:MAG: PAS domain S-box protein [Rhodanobacteraceae bacterium]|nr:MAG: PAS domain S-box protein [Rhodanobacteraceae bacterium]
MNPQDLPAASFVMLSMWFDIAPDAMIAVDREGVIVLANAQAERMFGYAHETLQGLTLEALVPESLRHAHRTHRHDYMAQPRIRPMGIGYELMGIKRDGQEFPLEIGLSSIATEKGVIAIASVRDISETRRVRQALERAQRDGYIASISRLALESPDYELAIRRILELTTAALELPAAAILATDWRRSTFHIRASTGLSEQTAQTVTSTLGDVDSVRGAANAREHAVITSDMLRDGASAAAVADLARAGFHDIALVPLYGRHETLGFLLALATAPGSLDEGKVNFLQSIAALLASAVQRSRTEEQLAHAQRLDAIGQLTGGVAHDFNNLLTVVSGNLQLLEAELSDRPTLQEIIDSALRAVDRGSDLTRRLLAFARRHPLQPRAVVPQPLMEELGAMLRRTLGEAILVQVDCAVDIPDVYADPNELDTALINLALNARDAMPRGGRLGIKASEATLDNADNPWKLPPGRYVAIAVSDTGTGMPPDVQAHAFEPFFTTKGAGKGSGLGLSMVYGFATQSGGAITIDSRLGYGTCVELVLPAAAASAKMAGGMQSAPPGQTKAQETILVVEDETDVRTVATRFLKAVGYHVIAAASAREALDLLIASPQVDLLFSDVVLGSGMDGVELAQEARRIRPELPILLTSGYRGPGGGRRTEKSAETFELLHKPYRREQLVGAIRRVLDGA